MFVEGTDAQPMPPPRNPTRPPVTGAANPVSTCTAVLNVLDEMAPLL